MGELTLDFSEPFYSGAGGSGISTIPLSPDRIAIDGRVYLIDNSGEDQSQQFRQEAIDVLQQRNTTSQRDVLLLPQNVWRWQNESWTLGAGQKNADRDDSMLGRYFQSFGVNPWESYELSMLNETRLLDTLDTEDVSTFLQVHGDYLVVILGELSIWYDGPDDDSPVTLSWTGDGTAIDVTYDGDDVIILTDSGKIVRCTDPTTTATDGTTYAGATFIAYVKGYLLVGQDNVLKDITGTPATVYTSPVAGFTWVGAAEGNAAIYLAGGSGDKHLIHRVGVKSDGTGLDTAVVAASLPEGEQATAIYGYLGYVFIGTTAGARMGTQASSSGDLLLGSLIPTGGTVRAFEGQERFVWATADVLQAQPSHGDLAVIGASTASGLIRMDLSSFTVTDSTPAYAADLSTSNFAVGQVNDVVTWGDVRVFVVNDVGIYLETANKVPAGWLDPGHVSFSVEDDKTTLYAQVKWEPLSGGVGLALSYDSGEYVRVLNWKRAGSTRSGNIPLNGAQFSSMDPLYVLTRDDADATKGPVLVRAEVRARPAKGRAARWYLPIENAPTIDINGVPDNRDVESERARLIDLVQTGRMVSLQEGRQVHLVVAVDYKWYPQNIVAEGSGWQGLFLLVVEEVR